MQAVRRIQRERERAGWALLSLQEAPNVQLRMQRQEVGLPHVRKKTRGTAGFG